MEKQLRTNLDLISNLPENIIEKILVHLPIQDAVKTSVLSTKWKYKWSTIPKLLFKHQDFELRVDKFITFIDRFLLNHRGPIQKFLLSILSLQNSSAIDSWFLFLSGSSIQILAVAILIYDSKYMRYKIPSLLFSFQELKHLVLVDCILEPPLKFNGLSKLRVLHLRNITIPNQEKFENMISSCPVLTMLYLLNINSLSSFIIRALKLKFFELEGYFDNINFLGSPNLTEVHIKLSRIIQTSEGKEMFPFTNVLGPLSNIRKLTLHGYFLQFLTMICTSEFSKLPVSYNHLKTLSLQVNFRDLNAISVTIWFLKKSPNLRKLEIHACSDTNSAMNLLKDLWEAHGKLDSSMYHLKVIKINDISGIQREMDFIKLLLANSPVLEVLSLTPCFVTNIKESTVLRELLTFRRASTNAEIQYAIAE